MYKYFRSLLAVAAVTAAFAAPSAVKAQSQAPDTVTRRVEMVTDYGTIVVKLYNSTPKHRDNFIKLVNEGFYDSLLFHRVIQGFMIQGGDPNSRHAKLGEMLGNGDVGYRIPAEIRPNLYHKKGALAAARDGNPEKASSGCQFYIVQGSGPISPQNLDALAQRTGFHYTDSMKQVYATIGGTPHLDNNYTVFGEVISGIEVVDQIAAVAKDNNDRPMPDVHIISMKVIQKDNGKSAEKKPAKKATKKPAKKADPAPKKKAAK